MERWPQESLTFFEKLLSLFKEQNTTNEFLNKIKRYFTVNSNKMYGISQNPNTKEYLVILNGGCVKCGQSDFTTVYLAKWEDGPLEYNINTMQYERDPNRAITLKCLNNTRNMINEFLDKVKVNSIVKESKGGFATVYSAIWKDGLLNEFLHEVKAYSINNSGKILKVYGISQDPNTKDFIIVLQYAEATEKQPFANCAHDELLALDICKGIRPEINEPEAPKCYIDLMKKCWDTDPNNRPDATKVEDSIRLLCNYEIEKQFKKAETYRRNNLSFFKYSQLDSTHPQAIYTSRLLNPFTKDLEKYDKSECLECEIIN
ncbi:kinase-like domain-containing protein [Rhizophagus irregularis DAOM 181602=DAOM 197198]|nr:kinase-like domain-containing protein [Rhizophagus irregularis DAOM 181602=DAOM 197198]